MEHHDLDQLLDRYAQLPVPSLPGTFTQDVLREIRLRKAEHHGFFGWIAEQSAILFRPSVLATCLALAVTVGVVVPMGMQRPVQPSLAVESLGLHVFSSGTKSLPSGLLARLP